MYLFTYVYTMVLENKDLYNNIKMVIRLWVNYIIFIELLQGAEVFALIKGK
jgi:hypothetical protein